MNQTEIDTQLRPKPEKWHPMQEKQKLKIPWTGQLYFVSVRFPQSYRENFRKVASIRAHQCGKTIKRNHYFESLALRWVFAFRWFRRKTRTCFIQDILQGSWTQFYEFINILIFMYIHLTSLALRTAQHSMVDSISSLLITLHNLNILAFLTPRYIPGSSPQSFYLNHIVKIFAK